MKINPFPNINDDKKVVFSKEEYEHFEELKLKLKNSIAPEEAKHYLNERPLYVQEI